MSRCLSWSVAAVVMAGVLVLSACSSTGTGAAGASSAAAQPSSSPAANAAKGAPVKIVTLEDLGTQTGADQVAGLKIGIAAVNAAGGINGRPIEQVSCTDNNDVNAATSCLRSALADSSVVALVGTGTTFGASIDPMLTAARMASVGDGLLTAPDFTCQVCFANTTGALTVLGQATIAVSVLHAKTIGVPYIGVAAGAGLPPLITSVVGPLGAKVVGAIGIPPTASDLTPQAGAEGAAKPDAVVDGLTTDLLVKFVHAYRSQGFSTPLVLTDGNFDNDEISSDLAGADNNLYLVSDFNHGVPAYQTFLSDKQKYDPGYPYHTDEVLRAYAAVKEFAFAAARAKDLTRSGILDAMNSLSSYDAGGLIEPPLNYTKPQTEGGGHFPRAFQTHLYLYKFEGGKQVPMNNGRQIDVFTGK